MTIFSSLKAAQQFGFQCYDFDQELGLYVVLREARSKDGRRMRELALARPEAPSS